MAKSNRLEALFKDYSSYHRTKGNQMTHYVGITLIVLSLLGLFGSLQIGPASWQLSPTVRLDGGLVLWAGAMLWYLLLDWRLAVPFGFITLGMYFASRAIPVPVLWGLFIGGWILQFLGHLIYEKKSPAFLKNGQHLLIGPFWICAKFLGYQIR